MRETPAPSPHHHAVQFYGSDASLFLTVAGFLSEGIVSGQPAIVIATPDHCAAIETHLAGRLVDCAKARQKGELVFLDAAEALTMFMDGDEPDPVRFTASIGGWIDRMLAGRERVTLRAYGEMVDVLWKQGRPEAAIKLEILWNRLAVKYNFALLCGYAMGSFYKQTQQLEEIVALHSEIVTDTVVPFERKRAAGR
jgi:hypothetical protein